MCLFMCPCPHSCTRVCLHTYMHLKDLKVGLNGLRTRRQSHAPQCLCHLQEPCPGEGVHLVPPATVTPHFQHLELGLFAGVIIPLCPLDVPLRHTQAADQLLEAAGWDMLQQEVDEVAG